MQEVPYSHAKAQRMKVLDLVPETNARGGAAEYVAEDSLSTSITIRLRHISDLSATSVKF